MSEALEREFKLHIPGEADLGNLRAALERLGARAASPRRQTNHFFDTSTGALRRARIALRLREEEGDFTLTLKGPLRADPAALALRPEEELELEAKTAQAVLGGSLDPLRHLAASPLREAGLVREARALVGQLPLELLGAFENERLRLGPMRFPAGSFGPALVFELDRTRFPGGRVERELELEVPDGSQAGEIEVALRGLLAELEIPFEPASSKLARFLASLESTPRG